MEMSAKNDDEKSINILIVGESGVGKTTCINSIPHYLKYKTLNKAIKKPLNVLIPTHFTYNTKNANGEYEPIEVKIGESDNENFKAGESHTLKPRKYSFEYKDGYDIHIIDTPGISDHRGIIQDKENMQEIIDFISELPHLNLIVFLLEPDKSTLSPTFEFCFKELIMQFHRNAAENIVFGFTRASSCGYEVGQTLVPLQLLLKEIKEKQGIDIRVNEDTSYAFDNAAFRHLCMIKQKQKPSGAKKDEQSYEKSFKVSRTELTRLLEYAIRVKPHDPKFTAMLNYTRNVILRLAGPMAMIATSVQKTIDNIREREADFEKYNGEEGELREKLFRPIIIIRVRVVKKLQTFCSNCASLESFVDDARFPFIEADPGLADQNPLIFWKGGDTVMNDDGEVSCPKCGPDFDRKVANRTFCAFINAEMRMDEEVADELGEVTKNRDDVAKELEKLRKSRVEMEIEREKIIKDSAKFAAYLKAYSIVPYNDLTENYLNVLIDVEVKKNGGTSELYKSLQQMKKEYLEEKRIFDENLGSASENDNTTTAITPENIKSLLEELVQLKHYGKDIRDAFTVAEDGENDENVDADLNHRDVRFSIIKPPKFIRKFFASIIKFINPF